MKAHLKSGLIQGMSLGFVGLISGVVGGWISLLWADGAEAVAAISAKAYFVLALLLPTALAVWTYASLHDEDRFLYISWGKALLMMLIAGFLGSIAASGLYVVTAINVPAIFGGEDQAELRLVLMAQIGWPGLAVVVVVTTLGALFWAGWAHRRAAA